jgi:hypothetical protein
MGGIDNRIVGGLVGLLLGRNVPSDDAKEQ